ncbi:MASE4 domain-containing protein [Ramlibacter sp. PS4R-6]|uniref:MASE4 domain-containing protein n=1 Tax=Ramlibacter sp. PS4R-6 TaxID=3133438 RepID=UPI0030B0E0BC
MKQSDASYVSTLRPAVTQRRAALTVAAVSVLFFAAAAPFAKQPLPQVPGFLPVYQSALVIFDLITSVLLLGQYRMLRSRALLLLAAGYIFSGAMAVAHLLSFPGLFGPAGLIGGGTQSTAWIYFLWHGGFPLFVIGYALSKTQDQRLPTRRSTAGTGAVVAIGAGAAAAMVLAATATHDLLPPIMAGNWDAPGKWIVAVITWAIGLAALATIWLRKPHTVLDIWLMVAMCVWTADTALAAVLNGARFDLGWYSGRIYGLLANGFVLVVLLLENGTLYARLAEVNRVLAMKNGQLADASRLKSEFVANMSHELRTPLNAIIGFSEVLKDGVVGEMKAEQREYVTDIHSSGQHLLSLINDILDLSKIEAGRMTLDLEPVEVKPLFEQSLAIVRERAMARRVRLELDVNLGRESLLLDARKTKQILYNLLSNAVKFSQPGGRVLMRVRRVEARDVKGWGARGATQVRMPLPQVSSEHFVEILVQDEGIGIAPDDADRLFTMFSQVDSSLSKEVEGTGLGLALVDQLSRLAGGTVALSSTPGEGTGFYVWLPWRDADAPPEPAGSTLTSGSHPDHQPIVLVIEDNDHAAELIRLQLEPEGFRVARVSTARAALAWIADGMPELIILDLLLPDMDGWDLLVQLKHFDNPAALVPVVIVSIVADAPRGMALGAAAVLQKPYSRDEMLAALNHAGFITSLPRARSILVDQVHKALESSEGVAS